MEFLSIWIKANANLVKVLFTFFKHLTTIPLMTYSIQSSSYILTVLNINYNNNKALIQEQRNWSPNMIQSIVVVPAFSQIQWMEKSHTWWGVYFDSSVATEHPVLREDRWFDFQSGRDFPILIFSNKAFSVI